MALLTPIKPAKKPRIGLYSIGLRAYWEQFPGLRERLIAYGQFIEQRLSAWGEVQTLAWSIPKAADDKPANGCRRRTSIWSFCHSATYSTSSTVLPVHQICSAPVVFLNLQPTARLNYERSTTGEWLAHVGLCPVPEFANVFNRAGIPVSRRERAARAR